MRPTPMFVHFVAAALSVTALGVTDPGVDFVDVLGAIEEANPEYAEQSHVRHAGQLRGTSLLKHAHNIHRFHHRHHTRHGFYNPDLPNATKPSPWIRAFSFR